MKNREDVRKLAALIFRRLELGYWGDIEPEVFRNVAHADLKDPETLQYNKLDLEQALDAAKGMYDILEYALDNMKKKKGKKK